MPEPVKQKRSLDQLTVDANVWDLAHERTAELMDRFDHVAVAFSGGKDSTAVLNIALNVLAADPKLRARHAPLRVVHYDEEAIPFETEDYVRRVAQREDVRLEWLCLPIKHRNACSRKSPYWWPWAPESSHLWTRPLPPEAITTWPGFPTYPPEARLDAPTLHGLLMPPHLGNTVLLMGIRSQESIVRRRMLLNARSRELNYLVQWHEGVAKRGNCWKGYPIYDWRHEDVWRAPNVEGWDYNRAYDRLEMAGVTIGMQRCSPAFGEEPLQKLWTYASCFPEVWDKMVDRVPGVGAAQRYALTDLYAYRARPPKPDGMMWPDYVRHYLTKFEPRERQQVATTLWEWLRLHYRETSQPIVENAPHPKSGLSWDFMLMIAMRGDLKSRKQPLSRLNHTSMRHKDWGRYCRELQGILDAGRWAELGVPPDIHPPATAWDYVPTEHRELAHP